jgi:hypothetical protein
MEDVVHRREASCQLHLVALPDQGCAPRIGKKHRSLGKEKMRSVDDNGYLTLSDYKLSFGPAARNTLEQSKTSRTL